MIPNENIDEILSTAQIEEVVGDFVRLKKRGANFIGLCPFHNEKTPSFSVSPTKGIYKCFGCGEGGNAVNFVMAHEHYSYPEALRYLAEKYNIEIQETQPSPEAAERLNERESLYVVHQFAGKYFADQLHKSEEGKAIGLSYLKERGFSEETISKFQLGYCPEKGDAFSKIALEAGYQLEYLQKSGLTKTNERGNFDFFRGRIIFPIHNLTGRVIAFGARILKKSSKVPKYYNSPENAIYHKSKVLYGIHQSKQAISRADSCLLVEGYTDVIALHQAGVQNVVASSGTSLTSEQIHLIKRYTQNITILFDGDQAGIKASFRGIDMILEAGMNVKVVLFDEGEDPDSFSKKVSNEDLQLFFKSKAADFILFKTQLLLKDAGEDPASRSALTRELLESIALIPDGITRSEYLKRCSQLLRVEEQVLLFELNKLRREKAKGATRQRETFQEQEYPNQLLPTEKKNTYAATNHLEEDIVKKLLNYGQHTFLIKTASEEEEKEEEVSVADFILHEFEKDDISLEHPIYLKIFKIVQEQLNRNEPFNLKHFTHHEDEEIRNTVVSLVSSPYEMSNNWQSRYHIYTTTEDMNLQSSVQQSINSFKLEKVKKMMQETQRQLKAEACPEDKRQDLLHDFMALTKVKELLAKELGRVVIH